MATVLQQIKQDIEFQDATLSIKQIDSLLNNGHLTKEDMLDLDNVIQLLNVKIKQKLESNESK